MKNAIPIRGSLSLSRSLFCCFFFPYFTEFIWQPLCKQVPLSVHFKVRALTQCSKLDMQSHWNHRGSTGVAEADVLLTTGKPLCSFCPPSCSPREMNARRLFQFSHAESHLNSRRSESDFVPGSHRSRSIARSSNCLRGISEPILRCYQTSVVVRQAQKKPLYTLGGCVWVQDGCVQTRMKFRFPMQEQLGRLISVLFGCLLIYWFIYSFWEKKEIISKNSTTPETSQAAHTPTCTQ